MLQHKIYNIKCTITKSNKAIFKDIVKYMQTHLRAVLKSTHIYSFVKKHFRYHLPYSERVNNVAAKKSRKAT